MEKQKVLIIKTGHTEVLDKESNSRVMSLGDVLRTTPLLNLYKDAHVTWVTQLEAFPLLEGNPYIARLLPYDFTTVMQLLSEEFDVVINLEKIPGICALSDKIRARFSRYGFTFNTQTGTSEAYDKAKNIYSVGSEREHKLQNQRHFQELLFELVGAEWKEEEYILGYKPKTKEVYDIGLNNFVGTKWPVKAWPMKNWDKLEKSFRKDGLSITTQDKAGADVLTSLYFYIDWINSCKMLITNDSLGLHIALALKKNVIGLFGPTPYKEIYFYGKGTVILPEPIQDCMPCFERECKKNKNCMEDITVEKVYKTAKNVMKTGFFQDSNFLWNELKTDSNFPHHLIDNYLKENEQNKI